MNIKIYQDEKGNNPYLRWLKKLKDRQAQLKIEKRLAQLRLENLLSKKISTKRESIGRIIRMASKSVDYEISLQERLQDKSYAVSYLNECALDNDSALMLLALSDVLKVHINQASFFIAAYARYLSRKDMKKLQIAFPELSDYFNSHQDLLGEMHA